MSYLDVNNLSFKYQEKPIFDGAEMRLFEGEHMVIVGPNGSGKTTLLNLLVKELTPDKGTINWLNTITVGYLDQYARVDKQKLVRHYLLEVYEPLFNLEDKMNNYYQAIANGTSSNVEKDLHYASEIQDTLLESDFYRIKSSLSNVIGGLGMDMDVLEHKIERLSSGMREKIILAKLLLKESDVLILDEPTNFLDVAHIEWLTKFLKAYEKTFIVVSHDEGFVKDIAKVVIAIENTKLTRYKGDYQFYLETRALRIEQQEKAYESQQREIKVKQTFVEKNLVRASTTRRAQSVRKALLKMEVIDKPIKPKKLRFWFPYSSDTGKEVLKVNDLVIGYNQQPLLNPFSFVIRKNTIAVITGHNGIGKSTLIKTIIEMIEPISGSYEWIDTARINYFSQELDLEENLTAFEHLYYVMDVDNQKEVYTLLAQYGITYEQARRPLSSLSGGQQTKVRLALMHQYKSNVLILDEPTNHLDIQAKEALKKALLEYQGTVILVTHEKEFYQDLNSQVIDFEQI